jgi:group I intron endonuclease
MRILKSHPLLKLLNSYLIDHSQPSNINYLWNFGSLLGICLGIQIASGVTLAMHYNPSVLEAFNSIEHIMRDVSNGWFIRYLHSNTASAFFGLVYLHIGRGLYYGSYRAPRTLAWTIGTVILILMIGTAFLGYLNIAQNEHKTTTTITTHIALKSSFELPIKSGLIWLHKKIKPYLVKLMDFFVRALVIIFMLIIIIQTHSWNDLKDLDLDKSNQNIDNNPQNKKDLLVLKTLAQKFPFFPEHYEQIKSSDEATIAETVRLQGIDNTYDRPTDEKFDSYNLKEGDKEYPKENIAKSKSIGSSIRFFSTLPINNYNKVQSNIINDFIKSKNLDPIFIYDKLENNLIRDKVKTETKGLSGIYLILNKETLDYYIGSASTNRFNARFSNHLFHLTGSKIVKNAVKKYGLKSFCFMVLELFPEEVTQVNNKKLLDLEDFYLKSLLPNYNILTEAGSSFGYKHTEITRLNMKTNYSEARRNTIGQLNRGKFLSEETKELQRKAALNREKLNYSELGVLNMKKASKPILVKNLNGSVYGEYSSIKECAENFNCSVKTVYRALKSSNKLLKKCWVVSYV